MSIILVIGAFNIEYIHSSCRAPFKDILGDSCITLNALPLSYYLGRYELEKYIIDIVVNGKISHVYVYHDWIKDIFSESFWIQLKNRVAVSAFYPDDEPGIWMNLNISNYDHHYTNIYTHSAKAYQFRINKGYENIYYMPWGFNEKFISPPNPDCGHDIVFVGKNKLSKESGTNCEDGLLRDELLCICAELAKVENLDFAIYGYGWTEHPILGMFSRGPLNLDEFSSVYGNAKVVFNPGWAPESIEPQVKLRHFEVFGTGGRQLTNYNPELYQCLGEQSTVIYFNNKHDFLEKLLYLLQKNNYKYEIKENKLLEHTVQNRLHQFLVNIGFQTNDAINIDRVYNLCVQSDWSFKILLENIKNFFDKNPAVDFVTVNSMVDSATVCIDSGLICATAKPDKINNFGVLFDFSEFQDNPLHYSDGNGELACEFVSNYGDFPSGLLGDVSMPLHRYMFTDKNNNSYFIDGLVFPRGINYDYFMISSSADIMNDCSIHYPIEYKIKKNGVFVNKPMQIRRRLFDNLRGLSKLNKGEKVAIYGVGGDLGRSLLNFSSIYLPNVVIYPIDNRLAGRYVGEHYIYDNSIIDMASVKIVCIAAESSGHLIYEQYFKIRADISVIRMYMPGEQIQFDVLHVINKYGKNDATLPIISSS
ncbi:glycosyltransferase [Aeromonas sp. MdU4]|uniref:glycosyltransferase family protein n=1 Tax=Aeromonas sp. MdU4 TaxID=3342819 RepID=UPI0035BA0EA9